MVMGILSVLAVLGVIVGMDFYRSYAFNSERDTVIAMLQKARSRSLNNMDAVAHGFRRESDKYILFRAPYNAASADNEIIPAHPAITGSGLAEVVFTQLSGTTSNVGLMVITDGKRTATTTINSEGRIEW